MNPTRLALWIVLAMATGSRAAPFDLAGGLDAIGRVGSNYVDKGAEAAGLGGEGAGVEQRVQRSTGWLCKRGGGWLGGCFGLSNKPPSLEHIVPKEPGSLAGWNLRSGEGGFFANLAFIDKASIKELRRINKARAEEGAPYIDFDGTAMKAGSKEPADEFEELIPDSLRDRYNARGSISREELHEEYEKALKGKRASTSRTA